MKTFTVRDVVEATGGAYFGPQEALDRQVTFVTSDSRQVREGALFVAYPGARVDGHDFMAACIRGGAACCLSQREPKPEETPCVYVGSTLTAVGALAAWHRSRFDIPVVGITGSVGKTTTKEMIAAVLSARFNTHKTEKNFNNEIGVPQTLLKLDDAHQVSVVEMGISDFGEMRRLTHMVRPNIAVISVIGDAHLEFLGDRAGVLRAKGEIFESMKPDDLAVLNGDDELLRGYRPNVRRLTYGMRPDNDFVAEAVENLGADGIRCTIVHHGQRFEARIPAFGVHMVYAALAAAAVGWSLGMTDGEIARGVAGYHTVGDRANVRQGAFVTVVSDCYNANPSSVKAAVDSMRMLPGRKVCILGDMLELGERSPQMHYETGAYAAKSGMALVLSCGALGRHMFEGARDAGAAAYWYEDKAALLEALPELIQKGDAVLVKASRGMAFEEITQRLTAME